MKVLNIFKATCAFALLDFFLQATSFLYHPAFRIHRPTSARLVSKDLINDENINLEDDSDREVLLRQKQLQWKKMRNMMEKGVIQSEEDMMLLDKMGVESDGALKEQGLTILDNNQQEFVMEEDSRIREDEIQASAQSKDAPGKIYEVERLSILREKQEQWSRMKSLLDSGAIQNEEEMFIIDEIGYDEELIGDDDSDQELSDSMLGAEGKDMSTPSFEEFTASQSDMGMDFDPKGMGVMALGMDWGEDSKKPGRRKKRKERKKQKQKELESPEKGAEVACISVEMPSSNRIEINELKMSEDYVRAIRKAEKKLKSYQQVLDIVQRSIKKELNDDQIISLGIKSLLRMQRKDEAAKLCSQRSLLLLEGNLQNTTLNSTMSLFVAFARADIPDTAAGLYDELDSLRLDEDQKVFTILELAGALFRSERNSEGFKMAQKLNTFPAETVTIEGYNQVIRMLGRARYVDELLQLLDYLKAQGLELNHESLEFVSNGIIQTVKLDKKSSSMKSLPAPILPEIVLMGRSNAGKSSLVNMLVNRKAMASTSATPGRTRHFTYYNVNRDREDLPEQTASSNFYLVDVPGLGFAETVDEGKMDSWRSLVMRYLQVRQSLRSVLHLVDSRHGMQKADHDLMKMVKDSNLLARGGRYYMILTKADKLSKEMDKNVELVENQIQQNGFDLCEIPILVTSSKTRLGKQELLRIIHKSLQKPNQ